MHHHILAAVIAVLVLVALWSGIGRAEGFEPSPRALVMRVFDHVEKKNITLTKGSIVSVRIEHIKLNTPQKQGMATQWVQGKKAFVSRASGKPKFILANGSIIIGHPVHVEAEGETRDDATAAAKAAIDELGKSLVNEASFRGLLAA